MNLSGIKNIIFDLGGVILNLSVPKTHQAFAELSGLPLDEIRTRVHHGEFFHQFEKGLISDAEFRQHLRDTLLMDHPDEELDAAWNALLLDIPRPRFEVLERLKKTHSTFLLSNTNNIHMQRFNQIVEQTTGRPRIDDYFHRAYFSHQLRMSKPDTEIYDHVLRENKLNPEETIFLDDNPDNLAGANKIGIRTVHVVNPDQLFSILT